MNKLRQWRDAARLALSRLTQREQLLVVGGAAIATLLVLLIISMLVTRAIGREQHRVDVKTAQLFSVLALQGDYQTRQAEQAQKLRSLQSSHIRLISLVEDAARQTGFEIGQLRPEEGEPSSNGVVESRVELRAAGLSADRLQAFLNRLDSNSGIVLVRRLKITRPYRKDTVDIEATVSTFKIKG